VRAVTDDEWPMMREGHPSDRAAAAMSDLYAVYQHFEPKTETEKVRQQRAVQGGRTRAAQFYRQ
jgi:hypothetical protein